MSAPGRQRDASREARHFEATDELVRAVLGIVQFHYGLSGEERTDADVAALHQRITDAALAYLDAPAIYPWPSATPPLTTGDAR